MPSLPAYNSNQNVTANPVAPESNMAAQPYKDIQHVTDTVTDITQKLSDANDVMQETKAKTSAEVLFAQQKQAARNDPNPNNAEQHLQALNDITQNATSGIDNKQAAAQTALSIKQSAFLTGIEIQDNFKKKQMFANDVNLDQLATTSSQNAVNAVSPAAAMQVEDNFKAQIAKNVNTGLITPDRGMALLKQYKVGVVKNLIAQNNSTNPADYKDVDKGVELDLREQEIKDRMIKSHIIQVKEGNVVNTLNSRVDTLKGVASGKLNWQNADQINQIAVKDPSFGSALQMVFEAQTKDKEEYVPTSKEGAKYAESVTKLMTTMSKEQINDYIPTAVKEISKLPSGPMEDRLAILVNAAEDRAKSLANISPQDVPPEVLKQEGGIQAVIRWNKQNGDNDPQTINDYLKGIHGGLSSSEAYNNAIKTKIIKDHPEVAAQADVPNRIVNQDSKSFHIFTGTTKIYPARIWNETLGKFEINPNREKSDNSAK